MQKRAVGRKESLKYQKGEKLSYKEAALAKCYECMNQYIDGKIDCKIRRCSLYPIMPYKDSTKN